MHKRELMEVERSQDKKKYRGRKNQYFKQIDNEDNDAGLLLDSDEEGFEANKNAKNELLEHETKLELMREEEEKQRMKDKTTTNRANAKARAMELTGENLRLKKMLEDQRLADARESRDFDRRIQEEESERQRILAGIEEKRRAQEAARSQIQATMDAKSSIQQDEVNDMLKNNRDRQKAGYDQQKAEKDKAFQKEKDKLEMQRAIPPPTKKGKQVKQEANIRVTSAGKGSVASGDSKTVKMSKGKQTPKI